MLEETGVKLDLVDDRELDEDDLVEVRSALFPIASRWKGVGIELRIKLSDLDTIGAAHPNSPEDCLTDVASRWLQKGYNTTRHGPPTWRKLVRAILVDSGGHNPGLAEKLAKNHQSQGKQAQESQVSPLAKDGNEAPASPRRNGSDQSLHMRPVVSITNRNYQMIRTRFASLVRQASSRLHSKEISAQDLELFLVTAYSPDGSNSGHDFAAAVIGSSPTIRDIFNAIGRQGLWSYWDFFLLEQLVEEFISDDTDLQASIEVYKEDLTGFFLATEIKSFLEAIKSSPSSESEQLPSPCPDQTLFTELSSKLDRIVTNRSLEYIRQLWKSLAKNCRLPLHTILQQRITEGCICIIWMIPFHFMPQLVRGLCESTAFFKEYHILAIAVDGVYLYNDLGLQLSDFPYKEQEMVPSIRRIALFAAAEHGNIDTLEALLAQSVNPNMWSENGITALMRASWNGHIQIVDRLLKGGAQPNLQHETGLTALMFATLNGHILIVHKLLNAGAQHDLQTTGGQRALMLASGRGYISIVGRLLKAGAQLDHQSESGGTALMEASLNGNNQIVDRLLKEGSQPDLQNNNGGSALMGASWNGNIQVVDSLLNAGAQPNLQSNIGVTALILASWNGNIQVVVRLLDAGAQPDTQNEIGVTALMCASWNGHVQIVNKLLNAGAQPDLQTNDGDTALTVACSVEQIQIVQLLLEARANSNHLTKIGKSPLLIAVRKGNKEIAQKLISAGANPNYIADDGFNALMVSSTEGDLEMVILLLSSSVDPNLKQPRTGYTALMLAAKAGHLNIVKKIISWGVNLDDTDKEGMTAADIACTNKQTEVHQELVNSGALQGSLIEPQVPTERADVIGELLKAFLLKMDKKSLLELKKHYLGNIFSDKPNKGLREMEPVSVHRMEHNIIETA